MPRKVIAQRRRQSEGRRRGRRLLRYSLLLKVILARTAGLAAGEGTLVVALASMDACMTGEMAAGGESAFACGTYVSACGLGVGELRIGERWGLGVEDGRKRRRQGGLG